MNNNILNPAFSGKSPERAYINNYFASFSTDIKVGANRLLIT